MKIWRETDRWSKFLTACFESEMPFSGYTAEEQCSMFMKHRDMDQNMTVSKGFATMLADMDYYEDSFRWLAICMLDGLEPKLRTIVIENILYHDPSSAGVIYKRNRSTLTDEEKEKLREVIYKTSRIRVGDNV